MCYRLVLTAVAISFLASTGAVHVPLVLAQAPGQTVLPASPRVLLDTSYTPPPGRTIAVPAGGDLQAALNAARPGDTVALAANALFRGNFRLPKKDAGSGWIIIRSAAPDEQLPPPGTRVTPMSTSVMPKILSPNQGPAVFTEPGAHHYRFIGVEFGATIDVKMTYAIIAFGGDQRSDADTPHDLIIDRCYVHGNSSLMSSRGVLLNSASSAIIDSHISEIHGEGYDSQAVLGYNGPGPFKIVNNFLEGAGENILFGGADPRIRDLVPSDIEIRRNHLFKPLSWGPSVPKPVGARWTLKNLLELKNAQRVLVEGNVLENMWGGAAVVLTPRNQDGTAPWSLVQDVLFQSNVVRNATGGFSLQTSDDEHPSQPVKRIAVVNNLWLIDRTFFGITGGRGGSGEDVLIDHNTAIPVGWSAYYIEAAIAPAVVRFRMTNNLIGFGAYGMTFPKPDESLSKWLPGAIIAKNALLSITDTADGQGATRNRSPDINQAMYASFPNPAAAGLNANGTLAPTSPLRRTGLDRKDIGVDFEELQRALTDPSVRR